MGAEQHSPRTAPISVAERVAKRSAEALIAVSSEERVLWWNDGAQKLLGYAADEVLGRSLIELCVPAEQRHDARAALARALETGSGTVEGVRCRKDGSRVYVEVTMQRVDAPGEPPCVAVNMHPRDADVLQERFSALIHAAPDAMVVVDQEGRIELVNTQLEQLFGYTREE